ncbi:MAG: biotin/lipoyl-binding protein, partial [Burkholderiales bacterium]
MSSIQENNIDLSSLKINRQAQRNLPLYQRVKLMSTIGVMLIIIALLWDWHPWQGRVEVETVQAIRLDPNQAMAVLTASGYIVAREKAEISSKMVGRIEWIDLEEGKHVKKGQLLAKLESTELQAKLRQVEANIT